MGSSKFTKYHKTRLWNALLDAPPVLTSRDVVFFVRCDPRTVRKWLQFDSLFRDTVAAKSSASSYIWNYNRDRLILWLMARKHLKPQSPEYVGAENWPRSPEEATDILTQFQRTSIPAGSPVLQERRAPTRRALSMNPPSQRADVAADPRFRPV